MAGRGRQAEQALAAKSSLGPPKAADPKALKAALKAAQAMEKQLAKEAKKAEKVGASNGPI